MTWNLPDPYASLVLSVGGGVLAGIVVILMEWGWRNFYGRWQRRKAIIGLSSFFRQWESTINSVESLTHPESGQHIAREDIQFAQHKNRPWTVPIMLSQESRHLSDKQAQEIALLLAGHVNAEVGILPTGRVLSQQMYDRFFSNVREISWLKF